MFLGTIAFVTTYQNQLDISLFNSQELYANVKNDLGIFRRI